jgi:hypothetical protein
VADLCILGAGGTAQDRRRRVDGRQGVAFLLPALVRIPIAPVETGGSERLAPVVRLVNGIIDRGSG